MIKRDRYSIGTCVFSCAQFATFWSSKRTRTPSTRILDYLWFDSCWHYVLMLRIHVKKNLRLRLNISKCTLYLVSLYIILRFSIRSTLKCSQKRTNSYRVGEPFYVEQTNILNRLYLDWEYPGSEWRLVPSSFSMWMSHPPPQTPHGRKCPLLLILKIDSW